MQDVRGNTSSRDSDRGADRTHRRAICVRQLRTAMVFGMCEGTTDGCRSLMPSWSRVALGILPRHWPQALRLLLFVIFVLSGCAKKPPQLTVLNIPITDSAFQSSLAAFTGAPVIGGNTVDILLNGDETFPALVEALRSAQKTITFEAFIFHKGKVADLIVETLADRCQAQVYVAILLDAHGASDLPKEYVNRLRNAGCHIVPDFRPLSMWRFGRLEMRDHRRIVVIDGRIGFTGGYGVDDAWIGDGRTKDRWRETNVRLEGPVVQHLQAAFMEHWREATHALLGGEEFFPYQPVPVSEAPVQVQVVCSSPIQDNFSLYDVFLQSIYSAQRSILISTPYLFPDEQLTEAFLQAIQRGVVVRVLIPSVVEGTGVEYVTQESHRERFGPLLDGGVQLNEYSPALLHTKMMIVDKVWATIGSTNVDNRSMGINDELNVIFYDEKIAKRLEDIFQEDLTHSRKISREQLHNRGWFGKALGTLTRPFHDHF